MRDLEDEARIKAYMAAKMAHIKMYNECMNLADGLDVEKFAELVRADEREACAKVCDDWPNGRDDVYSIGQAIRARGEKPLVKSYAGGKPNYCTPVDGVNMSQERVDETDKFNHITVVCHKDHDKGYEDYVGKCLLCEVERLQNREWVGLDGEIPGLGLVTEEFYNGMIFAEDILREKNGG